MQLQRGGLSMIKHAQHTHAQKESKQHRHTAHSTQHTHTNRVDAANTHHPSTPKHDGRRRSSAVSPRVLSLRARPLSQRSCGIKELWAVGVTCTALAGPAAGG